MVIDEKHSVEKVIDKGKNVLEEKGAMSAWSLVPCSQPYFQLKPEWDTKIKDTWVFKPFANQYQILGYGENPKGSRSFWGQELVPQEEELMKDSWMDSTERVVDDVLPLAMIHADPMERPFGKAVGGRQRKKAQYPTTVKSGRLMSEYLSVLDKAEGRAVHK